MASLTRWLKCLIQQGSKPRLTLVPPGPLFANVGVPHSIPKLAPQPSGATKTISASTLARLPGSRCHSAALQRGGSHVPDPLVRIAVVLVPTLFVVSIWAGASF